MDFDTSQGIVAVEYGRVLEYPKNIYILHFMLRLAQEQYGPLFV